MKVRIEESFPGELAGLTGPHLRRRLDVAVQKALGSRLPERGGEMFVVEEQAQRLADLMEGRQRMLMRDFAELLLEEPT